MYNTGQYDYAMLQALQSILSVVERIETLLSGFISNWFPILLGLILLVVAILILKWLVKL